MKTAKNGMSTRRHGSAYQRKPFGPNRSLAQDRQIGWHAVNPIPHITNRSPEEWYGEDEGKRPRCRITSVERVDTRKSL
jgi:hypothetical protein